MPKSVFFILFAMALVTKCFAQSDSVAATVVLIGDAGELSNGRHPVVTAVRSEFALDAKTTIIFLGDNLYKNGLPDDAIPGYDLAKAALDSQIEITRGRQAKVYFIPGNHDWENGGRGGYAAIVRQQQYVDLLGNDRGIDFEPKNGCPGPVAVHLTDDVILLIIDSQWWIQPDNKPGIESDCPYKTKTEVLFQIKEILDQNPDKLIIFAFHHTLRTYGIHGGYFQVKQHIFPFTDLNPSLYIPLPIIGSVYPITRSVFGTSEDLSHPLYAEMIRDLDSVTVRYKNVIFAAGHEHSLQLIKDMNHYYIGSGAASKSTRVSKGKNSLYKSSKNGFATLEISKNKTVRVKFYNVEDFKVEKKYDSAVLNFGDSPTPEELIDTARSSDLVFGDSVLISASDKYKNPSGFKKFFLGQNYRKEWSTPVKMKLFDLRNEKGGFKITGMGGGKQTLTLRLEDKDGKEWVLRTMDKDPEKAIPENLRGTLAHRIVQDLISASHPYGALIVPDLSHALNIAEAKPELFFVPDDPALGFYRKIMAGKVAMLEEREPTPGSANTISSTNLVNHLIEDHDDHVDQNQYLKARLIDDLAGDWDRHFDQWKWGKSDTGKGKLYYPVPRDRDQALYYSDGLLMSIVSKYRMRYVQSFTKVIPDISWLNWEARDMDNIFLNLLNKEDWQRTIGEFQQRITDSLIASAVSSLPAPIYKIDAESIKEKLSSRRDIMMKKAMKWYKFLSRNVTVVGSNQRENFNLTKHDEGLELTVYKMKRYDTTGIMYHRIFDPSVTKELRLYGLNGNDKFSIAPDVSSKIKVRMIGGKGKDSFDLRGNVRNYIYDLETEENGIANKRRTKINWTSDPLIEEYRNRSNEYNTSEFPHMRLGYNSEDLLLMGVGYTSRTFSFMKKPYATSQKVSALFALNHLSYQLKYEGIFNSAIFKKDLVVNAEFVNPTLNNYFGLGNETKYNKQLPLEYYRVRYKYVSTDVFLRKRINDILSVMAGPSYYQYWIRYNDNKSKILGNPILIGSDSSSIYSNKNYLGGKLRINIDFVNNTLFPTRGITWYTELGSMVGLNNKSKNVTSLTSDMTVYGSLNEERKVMGVFKIGAGKIFNKDFDYFQALNLGSNNFIRGFRKNRFSGSAVAYSSLEMRFKLFKSQSYILPGDVGVLGFYDVGRVWQYNQVSHFWHQAFGGGLYYTPYNLLIVSATLGLSDEGAIFNFSIGTKFNITF